MFPANQVDVSPVYRAAISAASSGANTVVAAQTGKQIRVLAYTVVAAAAVDATWKSASTAISGVMSLAANGGIAQPFTEVGCMQTVAGEALVLTLGGAVQVSGYLVYQIVG